MTEKLLKGAAFVAFVVGMTLLMFACYFAGGG